MGFIIVCAWLTVGLWATYVIGKHEYERAVRQHDRSQG